MIRYLHHQAEAASTNDVVAAWIRKGCADGQALHVDRQTAGRGRQGKRWEAPPGENLTLSIALVGPRYQPNLLQLPLAVGVAVIEALQGFTDLEVSLKWPNDLQVHGRKLGGILCEGVHDGQAMRGVAVGIGLNVQTPAEQLAQASGAPATSLFSETGQSFAIEELAASIRERVVHTARQLAEDRTSVLAAWSRHDRTAGRRVRTEQGEGQALGIDTEGALRVEIGGQEYTVRTGEVVFI